MKVCAGFAMAVSVAATLPSAIAPASAGVVAHTAPPSDYEALQAIQSRMLQKSSESYHAGAAASVIASAAYPLDVQLFRCRSNPNRLLPDGNGYSGEVSGHECDFMIYPAGEPAYRVGGFFYFDGNWNYYGSLSQPEIVQIDQFDQSYDAGYVRLKPGAIEYRGQYGGILD